jgi:hypothetical protein
MNDLRAPRLPGEPSLVKEIIGDLSRGRPDYCGGGFGL